MRNHKFDIWTNELIERLKVLWAEGILTREIGDRLGTTKSAIIGKAHRLLLPTRDSPIKPRPPGYVPRPARVKGATLPRRRSSELIAAPVVITDRQAMPTLPARIIPNYVISRVPFTAPMPRPQPAPAVKTWGRVIDCQWLDGDGPFTQCTDRSSPGRSYCLSHCRTAYTRMRDRREDAGEEP